MLNKMEHLKFLQIRLGFSLKKIKRIVDKDHKPKFLLFIEDDPNPVFFTAEELLSLSKFRANMFGYKNILVQTERSSWHEIRKSFTRIIET